MKISIYIWSDAPNYSYKEWRHLSEFLISQIGSINYIIINHHIKQYRKNFKCTKHQLTLIIKKAKTITNGESEEFTI